MQFTLFTVLAAASAALAGTLELGPGDLNACLISCAISSAGTAGCSIGPSVDAL